MLSESYQVYWRRLVVELAAHEETTPAEGPDDSPAASKTLSLTDTRYHC